ncbi:uncharacterized protein C16orf78 homolog isoform X3 [Rattus norvegicus]|uniref:uncharacterized protein C16orf78 homolog isoform X3 n=1 Tax=Rattus norvegicus TaxID=10116 RepID=UPI001916FA89|nr:uncharacterized protein C16orf78 homolog isoform X3 [Rattus norvegicus]
MTQEIEDTENLMPTERKSFWRTPEERRMSDLTRVLEWLERRQGKKRALQKKKEEAKGAEEKGADKKTTGTKKKPDKGSRRVTFNKVPAFVQEQHQDLDQAVQGCGDGCGHPPSHGGGRDRCKEDIRTSIKCSTLAALPTGESSHEG